MGLVVSVIVVCVGVYKFIQIYCKSNKLFNENIEVECNKNVLNSERLLVTESSSSSSTNKNSEKSRKFIITNDEGSFNLREFYLTKSVSKDNPDNKKFILIDTKESFKKIPPLPLPEKFIITQLTPKNTNVKQGIGINLNSYNININEENLQKSKEVFHRDPSPYPPNLDVTKHITDKHEKIETINENQLFNNIDIILNTCNNTTEYTTNKILVVPSVNYSSNEKNTRKRSKSATRNEEKSYNSLRKISSSSKIADEDYEEPSTLFINVLKKKEDLEFKNSLDGLKKGCESRRSFKKKRKSQSSFENDGNDGNSRVNRMKM